MNNCDENDEIKVQILIFINDTQFLKEKIETVVEIIDSARSNKESILLDKFKFTLQNPIDYGVDSKLFILEKESWEYEVEKSSWIWDGVDISGNRATLSIFHAPLSNYSDLLHLLIYIGIDVKNIEVKDELFGAYKLIDVVKKENI